MKKKEYITPEVEMIKVAMTSMLCSSELEKDPATEGEGEWEWRQ